MKAYENLHKITNEIVRRSKTSHWETKSGTHIDTIMCSTERVHSISQQREERNRVRVIAAWLQVIKLSEKLLERERKKGKCNVMQHQTNFSRIYILHEVRLSFRQESSHVKWLLKQEFTLTRDVHTWSMGVNKPILLSLIYLRANFFNQVNLQQLRICTSSLIFVFSTLFLTFTYFSNMSLSHSAYSLEYC